VGSNGTLLRWQVLLNYNTIQGNYEYQMKMVYQYSHYTCMYYYTPVTMEFTNPSDGIVKVRA